MDFFPSGLHFSDLFFRHLLGRPITSSTFQLASEVHLSHSLLQMCLLTSADEVNALITSRFLSRLCRNVTLPHLNWSLCVHIYKLKCKYPSIHQAQYHVQCRSY